MLGSGVLQVVVEPSYHIVLESFWYDHLAIFTEYFDVYDQLGGKSFHVSLFF